MPKNTISAPADNMDISAATIISVGEEPFPSGHFFRREPGFPYYTLGCILSGRIVIQSAAGSIDVRPVSISLTPPNTPYTVSVLEPHREIWIIFTPRPDLHPWLNWGQEILTPGGSFFLPLPEGENRERMIRSFRNVLDYCHSTLAAGPRLAELALEQVLVLAASLSAKGGALDERLERVIRALRQNLAQPWREDDLAGLAHLSASRFAHLFQEKIGMSPLKFLEHLRMKRAKDLLLTTAIPVKEIASGVGYPDALHFSARFRRIVGRCPSRFRHLGSPAAPSP